ncbi:ABC transporter permease [Mycolicibacterium sp.]|uniref:ABC transporter permease n=1 Tax=Mycolicibacterium sp. TaxID=2320850 RepID=UPI0037C73CE7
MTSTRSGISAQVESTDRRWTGKVRHNVDAAALPILLFAVLIIGFATTAGFGSAENLTSILVNASIVGIAAVGMTAITLSGSYISLAAQQMVMMGAISYLLLVKTGLPLAIAMLLGAACVCLAGIVQGLIVAAGFNPVITTLAAGSIIFGIMTAMTGGKVIVAEAVTGSFLNQWAFLGITAPVYVFIVFTAAMQWFVVRSVPGRRMKLIGANRATARISGIPLTTTITVAFGLFGLAAAVAGICVASRLGQGSTNDLQTLTFDVLAAVLVGGTAIQGGQGSPLRSATGAVLIAALSNVMVLQGHEVGVRLAVSGTLVALVVIALHYLRGAHR